MTAKNPTLRLVGGSDVKPTAAAERLKRKPGRQSNPLRPKFLPISPAVTIFGKIQKSPEDLPELCTGVSERWLEVLRAGAEAPQLVVV
jgi:hypothetical protein